MKKILIIFIILLLSNISFAKSKYKNIDKKWNEARVEQRYRFAYEAREAKHRNRINRIRARNSQRSYRRYRYKSYRFSYHSSYSSIYSMRASPY